MDRDARENAIIRDLLERIDDSAEINQRALAEELGIALGMANAYVKRCVKKGWVKVRQVPARRYRYYLTPTGFAEKSRLTADYLRDSLKFIRRARQSFERLYDGLESQGVRRVVLYGADELTEVAVMCALSRRLKVVGVVRGDGGADSIGGVQAFDRITAPAADCWVLATTDDVQASLERARARAPEAQVVYPDVLGGMLGEDR